MKDESTKIILAPDTYASVRVGYCLSDVRVEGWIHGRNKEHIFSVCPILAALFGEKHTGCFCMNKDDTSAPFSFDMRAKYISNRRQARMETKEELMERVQKLIRQAARGNKKRLTENKN